MKNYKTVRIGIIVSAVLVLIVFRLPSVQELVLELGENIKGTPLRNPDKWIGKINSISYLFAMISVSIFFTLNNCIRFRRPVEVDSLKDPVKKFCLNFPNFIVNNIPLVLFISLVALVIHGIKLGEQVIPIDTEFWLEDRTMNWKVIGRFSLILLQGVTTYMGQNLYLVNFFTIFFLITSVLSWCYLLNVVTGWDNKFAYFAFSLVYCICPIWVDILYFTCLSLEVALVMTLIPVVVYLSFIGLTSKYHFFIIWGCIILSVITGVYQSLLVVFCCGLLICFFFFCMSDKFSPKNIRKVFFKGVICIMTATLCYFVIDKLLQQFIFKASASDYLVNQSNISILHICAAIPVYFVRLLDNWPMELMLICLLFPALFIQEFFSKESGWGKIVVFLIVMTMFAFPLVTGGGTSFRVQLMEPIVMGFTAFLVFGRMGNGRKILKCIFIGICLLQIQDSSLVNYTDYLRYQQDKMVAYDIHRELQSQKCGDLPVILYGEYSPHYFVDYKVSEVAGHSIFEWTDDKDFKDSTTRGLLFMRSLGYEYHSTNDVTLIQKARSAAESMNDYPKPGFVQNLGDVVVIRLSETSYMEDTNKKNPQ